MFKHLWNHLSKLRKIQFILFLALTIVGSFLEVVSLGAIIPFLAALSNPEKMLTYPFVSDVLANFNILEPDQIMMLLTLFFAAAALAAGLIRLLIMYLSPKLAFMTAHDLGVKVYRLFLHQPYEKHLEKTSSEIIAGVTAKTLIFSNALHAGISFINSFTLIVFISTALVLLDPKVAMMSASGIGIIYLLVTIIVRKQLSKNSENVGQGQSETIKAIQEGLGNIRDVILDSSQQFYCNIFNSSDKKLRVAQASNMFIQGSPKYIVESLGMIVIAGVAYSLSDSGDGLMDSLPLLGALALGAQRLLPALQQVYATWSLISGLKKPLLDVLELLDQPEINIESPPNLFLTFNKGLVEFRDVSFCYASNQHQVLFDLNFSFPKGSKVAFVGSTGSGKSTIIDLIMGLLSPSKGKILIDDKELNSSNLSLWQKKIAHVPQKIHLMDSTIAENIGLGSSLKEIDQNLLKKVAKQAQLYDFIINSPDGFNTLVGEAGKSLSGGQIQRIGIARALYKQASVLVLDEASSALDGVTENNMMNAISEINKDLTIILVTHRLSTVKDCDIIFELESGKLVSKGTYNELINKSDIFKKMVEV